MRAPIAAAAVLILAVVAAGCGVGDAAPANRLQKAIPKYPAVSPPAADGVQPGELATVVGEEVIGRTSPDGTPFEVAVRTHANRTHLTRRFGSRSMELGARSDGGLTQYPCTACHQGSTLLPGVDPVADAHGDVHGIAQRHPQETGASCTSCHAPENPELLVLGSGERATLDHAYRLCAQCHAPQVSDWAAGAHGKRLDGWQGRRVVMGCADCHNPHQPALERRIPFRPPQIRRPAARQ